jgi:uncharacterized membrane protein
MKTLILDKMAMILLTTTLLTGLLAGVFFTWTNAITPGIGKLNDVAYLQAFQHMNRTIINPMFYIVIVGPLFLSPLSAYVYKSSPSIMFWTTLGSSIIYFLGVFVVTMLGNIPLNVMLDQADLTKISTGDAKHLRESFETKWNQLHLIRTVSSSASFLLLILACLSRTDHNK